MTEQFPPAFLDALRRIGIDQPDVSNPLHVKLIDALRPLGPASTLGQRVVAMRWVFNWELNEAGKEFATAKSNYEHHMAKAKTRLLAEPKMSVAKAEAIAEAEDESYRLKLTYLLAEQRERSMRKFLDTLDAALDNHRTDRADARAGDTAHAQGYGGGA